MMSAFGGVGINVTNPDELKQAVNDAMNSGKPTLIRWLIRRRQRKRPDRHPQSTKRVAEEEIEIRQNAKSQGRTERCQKH